jgi:hypothetical protein
MLPKAADQSWQVLGQDGETPLPGAAGGKLALLVQEGPQLLRYGILLGEKREQRVGRIEAPNNHDHHRLQDEPVRICLRASPGPFGRLGGSGESVHEQNEADEYTLLL